MKPMYLFFFNLVQIWWYVDCKIYSSYCTNEIYYVIRKLKNNFTTAVNGFICCLECFVLLIKTLSLVSFLPDSTHIWKIISACTFITSCVSQSQIILIMIEQRKFTHFVSYKLNSTSQIKTQWKTIWLWK